MRRMMLRERRWLGLYFGDILINSFLQRQTFSKSVQIQYHKKILKLLNRDKNKNKKISNKTSRTQNYDN